MDIENNNKSNKILVDFLAIKVNIDDQRHYYNIIYHPINCEHTYVGYGSYKLSLVEEWLGNYFILKEM